MAVIPVNISTDRPVIAANLEQLRYLVFQGMKGDTGQSAYELAVSLGFEGTEAEWIASLQGADGADGTDGADGKNYGIVVDGSVDNVLELKSVEASGGGVFDGPALYAASAEKIDSGTFAPNWWLKKGLSDDGVADSDYAAVTAGLFDTSHTYTYYGATKDNADKRLYMYIGKYDSNFNYLGRESVGLSNKETPFDLEFPDDCAYFRLSFGRPVSTGVEFTEADLGYFRMTCVDNDPDNIPENPANAASNDVGVVGNLFDLAEEYLNYAYQDGKISGLVYHSVKSDGAEDAYCEDLQPVQTVQTADGDFSQYTIQCSILANLMIRAVALSNSRYMLGSAAKNISQPWGYCFDTDTPLVIPDYNNVVWSYSLLRYAVEKGYAYRVNANADNIKPGDLLFGNRSDPEAYQGVGHVMIVLAVGADGRVVIFDATSRLTRESGGTTYDVGIRTAILDIKTQNDIVFGARYPLGAAVYEPEIIYRTSDITADTYAADAAVCELTSGVEKPQGLYTVVAKGSFSAPPVVAVMYSGDEVYTQPKPWMLSGSVPTQPVTMLKSGDVYTLPVYVERPFTGLALLAPDGGVVVGDVELVAVGHGFLDSSMSGGPIITVQPRDVYAAINTTVKFTVAAEGGGLTYQWQISDDGGSTWTNSAVKEAEYSTKLTTARVGRLVRCIVTDANGRSVTSTVVTMHALAAVAMSGSYNDLTDRPTVETGLPAVTATDNGKVLKVVGGEWGVGTDETGGAAAWEEITDGLGGLSGDLLLSASTNVSAVSFAKAFYCAAIGVVRFVIMATVTGLTSASAQSPQSIEVVFDANSHYKPACLTIDGFGAAYGAVSAVSADLDTTPVSCAFEMLQNTISILARTYESKTTGAQIVFHGFYYTEDLPTT